MGSCLTTATPKEISIIRQNNDHAANHKFKQQNPHFFMQSTEFEQNLCISTAITHCSTTSEFVTPQSYHAYSFKSYDPTQYYSNTHHPSNTKPISS